MSNDEGKTAFETLPEIATPPFTMNEYGFAIDATGSRVLVCSVDFDVCSLLYSEDKIDADKWFICPNCGRLGQRMDEAPLARCGLTKPTANPSENGKGER